MQQAMTDHCTACFRQILARSCWASRVNTHAWISRRRWRWYRCMRVHASIDMAVRESRFASSLLQFWVTWFSGDVPHLLALIYKTRQQLARKCFLRTWWANARSCFDDTTFRGSWSHLVQDSNDGRRRKKKYNKKMRNAGYTTQPSRLAFFCPCITWSRATHASVLCPDK